MSNFGARKRHARACVHVCRSGLRGIDADEANARGHVAIAVRAVPDLSDGVRAEAPRNAALEQPARVLSAGADLSHRLQVVDLDGAHMLHGRAVAELAVLVAAPA